MRQSLKKLGLYLLAATACMLLSCLFVGDIPNALSPTGSTASEELLAQESISLMQYEDYMASERIADNTAFLLGLSATAFAMAIIMFVFSGIIWLFQLIISPWRKIET